MKPPPFDYVRPDSLQAAVGALADLEWGGRLIAGGQSLVPMLNLRLAPLVRLVDVSRLEELRCLEETSDAVLFGACIRHAEFEDSEVPDATNGLMQQVAAGIAYRAIRNRGTIGGSVSLADPSADWITPLIALGARFNIVGQKGKRVCQAADMFTGPYTTNVGDHEILVSIEVPKLSAEAQTGYYKIVRKAGEFAMAMCTAIRDKQHGLCNVVLGCANRKQILLPNSSTYLADVGEWSDQVRADFRASYRKDMQQANRMEDLYELKLCETAVLQTVESALVNS